MLPKLHEARQRFPNGRDTETVLVVNITSQDADVPASNSEKFMQATTPCKLHELLLEQRAARSDSPRPPKPLHKRVMSFIKECTSRVQVFFAQKKIIADFTEYLSQNRFPADNSSSTAWLNMENDLFCHANFGDVEKVCSELCRKINDVNLEQLERVNDYISNWESCTRIGNLRNLRYVYNKFFLELSNALMSRTLDLGLGSFVELIYIQERGRGGKDPIFLSDAQMPAVFSKVYDSQLRSMANALPEGADLEEFSRDKTLKLKNFFLEKADGVYGDVCSKNGNGALTSIAYKSFTNKIEKEFHKITNSSGAHPAEAGEY